MKKMKNLQILVAVVTILSLNGFLSAGEMLDINGDFGGLKNEFPAGWYPNKPGYWEDTATISLNEIPETEKCVLQVTSQTQAIHLYTSGIGTAVKKWPIANGDQCIIKARIKGSGEAGLGVYFYPAGVFKGKEFQATEEWRECVAELTMYATNPDIDAICVVLEVGPGAKIEFSDVTAEIVKN
jgi:hypothetical protein